jgi:hypothetical protein
MEAYTALRAAQGDSWNPGGADVLPIVEQIVAQPAISPQEARIVGDYYWKSAGPEQQMSVYRTLAPKSPFIAVTLKYHDKDATGWTTEMMEADPRAVMLAVMYWTNATADMKAFAFNRAMATIPRDEAERGFFKGQRRHLAKGEQIAVTQKQKDLLLAKTGRTETDNAWLAEVSADLIALQLDQR